MTWKKLKAGAYESADGQWQVIQLPERIRVPRSPTDRWLPKGRWIILYNGKFYMQTKQLRVAKRIVEKTLEASEKVQAARLKNLRGKEEFEDAAVEALGEEGLPSYMRYNVTGMAVRQFREGTRPEGTGVPGEGHYRTLKIAKKAAELVFARTLELERQHPQRPLKELKVWITRGHDRLLGSGIAYMWHNDPSFEPIEIEKKGISCKTNKHASTHS